MADPTARPPAGICSECRADVRGTGHSPGCSQDQTAEVRALNTYIRLVENRARAAERLRLAAVITPERFRELAGWFDDDDALKMTLAADPLMVTPPTWRERGTELQQDLRRFADLLEGDPP